MLSLLDEGGNVGLGHAQSPHDERRRRVGKFASPSLGTSNDRRRFHPRGSTPGRTTRLLRRSEADNGFTQCAAKIP